MDGELVALDATGKPSFSALQTRALVTTPRDIAAAEQAAPTRFFVFDLLHFEGIDLRQAPYRDRHRYLTQCLMLSLLVQRVHPSEDGEALLAAALENGFEGALGKRADRPTALPCDPANAITLHTNPETTMTCPMYTHSVPVFKQMLNALKTILAQVDAQVATRSIEPDAFLQARLFPDMFPLLKQVQIAADFSRGISARLAGVEVPAFEGTEKSFADLDALLSRTLAFLEGLNPAQFDGSESREIVLRPGTPKEKRLSGQAYLANYGSPQFFFHVTTAYAILRHNGIAIGKRDYMGAY